MFLNVDDAATQLAEVLDPPQLEMFLPLLQPVVGLVAAADAAPGTSQIGGRPRAAPGFVWPAVDAAALLPATLDSGSAQANAENRAHLAAGVPMAFVARIDLPTAAQIPHLAALPDDGQLLFFYDFLIGPYESSAEVGRVIWDRGEGAAEIPPPEALTVAAGVMRAKTAATNAQYSVGEDWDGYSTVLDVAARPASFVMGVELPSTYSVLPQGIPDPLGAIIRGDQDLPDEEYALFEQYQEALYLSEEVGTLAPIRLVSAALPEQDDPRYDAAIMSLFGNRPLNPEEWSANEAAITAAARDWITLAQVDVAAWLQQSAEGQVYFLIHKDDLAAERFDQVICVYQQT